MTVGLPRFAVPDGWEGSATADHFVAVLTSDHWRFASTIVMNVDREAGGPLAGIDQLAGSVLLSVGRFDGPFPADQVIFGYPLDTVAVTVVRLVGDPMPGGRLVVTFSADAERFADQWPAVQTTLRTLEVTA